MKKFLWTLPLAYMALIWTLSSFPADEFVALPDLSLDRIIKESLHLVEFGILYLLFALALYGNGQLTKKTSLLFAIIACLYGALDEIHQSFVPYRSATWIDLVKDVIGVTVAYYFVNRFYFLKKNKLEQKL
ncbi:VanZ family protein [Robertmurraya beringensis]|uniref:VanZ family protein n=1 Tax=Robertmurraya beringensis TaxID=641660 RepID=A0ABV6KR64_9BACI